MKTGAHLLLHTILTWYKQPRNRDVSGGHKIPMVVQEAQGMASYGLISQWSTGVNYVRTL